MVRPRILAKYAIPSFQTSIIHAHARARTYTHTHTHTHTTHTQLIKLQPIS